jgi:hypothetical protein
MVCVVSTRSPVVSIQFIFGIFHDGFFFSDVNSNTNRKRKKEVDSFIQMFYQWEEDGKSEDESATAEARVTVTIPLSNVEYKR